MLQLASKRASWGAPGALLKGSLLLLQQMLLLLQQKLLSLQASSNIPHKVFR